MKRRLRILIVDDNRQMTRTLADILALEGHIVTETWSGVQALETISRDFYDCVLTDVIMPGMNGVELYKQIRAVHPDMPVLLMTAHAADDILQAGLAEGAAGAMEKPLNIGRLLKFLDALPRLRVLSLVDDDPNFCKTLADILEARGYSVRTFTDPHTSPEKIVGEAQVLLIDMKLKDITGAELLEQVRRQYPTLSVLLITGYPTEMTAAIESAMSLNARACLHKPLVMPELLNELAAIQRERFTAILGTL